jgi:hypothetical protein
MDEIKVKSPFSEELTEAWKQLKEQVRQRPGPRLLMAFAIGYFLQIIPFENDSQRWCDKPLSSEKPSQKLGFGPFAKQNPFGCHEDFAERVLLLAKWRPIFAVWPTKVWSLMNRRFGIMLKWRPL